MSKKPRTKPKRYDATSVPRGALWEGHASGGMWNPEFAAEYGKLVAYWPHIEDRLQDVMGELIGSFMETPTRQVFRAIASQDARIKVMRSLLQNSKRNKNKGEAYDDIIDDFEKLNRKRNKFVHGLWWTHDSGRMYLQPASTEEFSFLSQREVKIEEIKEIVAEMSELWRRVMDITFLRERDEPEKKGE